MNLESKLKKQQIQISKFLKFTTILFTWVYVNFANAGDWNVFSFSTVQGKDAYLFDSSSVQIHNNMKTVWIKRVNWGEPDPNSDSDYADDMQWEFNCSQRKAKVLAQIKLNDKLKTVYSSFAESDLISIPPDTKIDLIYKNVCQPDFPKNKTGKNYSRLEEKDDPYEWTKEMGKLLKMMNPSMYK